MKKFGYTREDLRRLRESQEDRYMVLFDIELMRKRVGLREASVRGEEPRFTESHVAGTVRVRLQDLP